ncbi:hypothetical protein LTR36_009529 [Oleoguttula mirabilis]|uniref:rRNA-processing protein EFG1 n=1 Tax=Oleoguttula mirabilis TaxID=1507867 RepID=A0AAV9JTM1_9PEZI|nr:hypothetical protein LTR36_009529 [Oleoguttula mirabilis]
MATKRAAPSVHPSRLEQVPEEPRRKRQKPNHISGKSFKKAHTVNDLKSQIRSLSRLLDHNDDLPANIRIEKERALQTAQHELDEEQRAKKRSDMIGRYHKVRFFDRQKATKRLKRAKKELIECVADSQGKRAGLEKRVEEGEVDVAYAMYYPLDQPYRALFPTKRKKDGDAEEDVAEEVKDVERQGDPEMWQKVKQCMAEGTLDALRNGKLTTSPEEEAEKRVMPVEATIKKKKRQKEVTVGDVHGNRRERRSAAAAKADSDNESEGGFFE